MASKREREPSSAVEETAQVACREFLQGSRHRAVAELHAGAEGMAAGRPQQHAGGGGGLPSKLQAAVAAGQALTMNQRKKLKQRQKNEGETGAGPDGGGEEACSSPLALQRAEPALPLACCIEPSLPPTHVGHVSPPPCLSLQEVKAPRKTFYRQRAHSNPLNDATFPVPLSPDHVAWCATAS